jgi:hypothetical protein
MVSNTKPISGLEFVGSPHAAGCNRRANRLTEYMTTRHTGMDTELTVDHSTRPRRVALVIPPAARAIS